MFKFYTWVWLALFSLLLFVPGISTLPVIDRDEAHFAQASRQMIQTGNYFQIRFQDKTRFQKPPGINWLQASSVKLFSNADASHIWPYRIPSVLGALFSVLLTYFFAKRFVSPRSAAIAAGLLASSLLLIVEAHMAVIDTSLLSSILLMEGSLWIIYQAGLEDKKVHWGWALIFWLAMTYGFVLKGVTPLVGLFSVVTLCLVEKRADWLRGLRLFSGFGLFILLNVIWLLLINEAEQSNYLMQMFNKDLLPKLKGGHESHGKPPLFHLFILPLTFWPASLFLWIGGTYAWKNRRTPVVKFLLAWIIPTWIFFECMPTKLPQYMLPVFPAISLLCALAIESQFFAVTASRWLRFLQILWGMLSLGLGFSLVLVAYLIVQQPSFLSFFLLFLVGAGSLTAIHFVKKGDNQRGLVTLLVLAGLFFPLTFNQLLPHLKPIWLTTSLSQQIDKKRISSDKPLLVVGFEEPSLVFNFNTNLVSFTDKNTAINKLANTPHQLALFEASTLQGWMERPKNIAILGQFRGFNYNKGRWVKLILIGQKFPGENDDTI